MPSPSAPPVPGTGAGRPASPHIRGRDPGRGPGHTSQRACPRPLPWAQPGALHPARMTATPTPGTGRPSSQRARTRPRPGARAWARQPGCTSTFPSMAPTRAGQGCEHAVPAPALPVPGPKVCVPDGERLAPRGPVITEPPRAAGGRCAECSAPGLVEPAGTVAISRRYREEGARLMRAVNGVWGSEPSQVGGTYCGTWFWAVTRRGPQPEAAGESTPQAATQRSYEWLGSGTIC